MPRDALADFLSAYPPEIRSLARAARALVLATRPGAHEKVWPGWKTIGFGNGPGMKDCVVGIGPAKAHVSLVFYAGRELADPAGLLEGSGKAGRHLKVRSKEELSSPPVRALLKAAFARRAARPATKASRPRAGAERATPGPGDAAVTRETGRDWKAWKALLDAEGAASLDHKGIVALLSRRHGLSPWWQQTVAIGYEKLSGIRERNQPAALYQVGVSRTVAAALPRLWAAWVEPRTRARWLGRVRVVVRKATEERSLRVTWEDGSNLEVLFAAKGKERSQVTVDHRKLPPGEAVARMRSFWKERLDALRDLLEAQA